MQLSSLLGHSSELVRIIRKSPQAGDSVASEYFRSKKYLGSSDRRFISGLVFHTLRTLVLSEAIAEHLGLEDVVHGAHVLMDNPDGVDLSFVDNLPLHVQVCTQNWMLESTLVRWPTDAPSVWRAMMSSAPLGLRVNLRRSTRDKVLRHLTSEGVECTAGAISPAAIIIHQRINLQQHPLFLSGVIEIQDEGSQLVGYACSPNETDSILDACAGAGGKSLQLADMQNDKGQITAHDIEWKRLKEVPTRANRAGVKSVWASVDKQKTPAERRIQGNQQRESGTATSYNIVLVDAPCSGLGTVRRLPVPKWRVDEASIVRHSRKQLLVLSEYAPHVCPGGVLIYSTCSIMPQENEHVVEKFLQEHPEFEPDPLAPYLAITGLSDVGPQDYMFQADPFHHGTDGLFMARMVRTG